jgi:hypothetical protein
MITIRAILGGILLFLGRELNFLFAGGMAALIAFRVSPSLPAHWPAWSDMAVILGVGAIAAGATFLNERGGYALSGFLGGGYLFVEYFAPGASNIPLIPFIVGSGLGAALMAFFNEWAMMIISSIIGSYFVVDLFTFPSVEAKMMVSGGLFLAGALTQVIIRRIQQK